MHAHWICHSKMSDLHVCFPYCRCNSSFPLWLVDFLYLSSVSNLNIVYILLVTVFCICLKWKALSAVKEKLMSDDSEHLKKLFPYDLTTWNQVLSDCCVYLCWFMHLRDSTLSKWKTKWGYPKHRHCLQRRCGFCDLVAIKFKMRKWAPLQKCKLTPCGRQSI